MRLTVVGCSGSYPGPDSPASCYLVEADHDGHPYRLVVDLGNGALGYLHRHVDPLQIDAALVSHLHPDHCLDFTSYYVLRRYHPDGPFDPLPVWAPADADTHLARAYGLHSVDGIRSEFVFHRYPEEPFQLGPFTISVARVDHPVEAYAIRFVAGGRTLVYTGDTDRCDALATIATGADLLLSESSFLDDPANPRGLHMSGRDAGEVASAAHVGRLLLTHIPHWYDPKQMLHDARLAYAGRVDLAEPGVGYDV